MPRTHEDPRLREARCTDLVPVSVEHRNPYFSVLNRGGYFTTEFHQQQVVVLPVVERSVVLVRVKRPVVADEPLELPAGGVEPGETAVEAAARELWEEAGVEVRDRARFRPQPPISTEPGRNPRLVHVVRVDLSLPEYQARRPPDDEVTSVQRVEDGELRRMLRRGDIYVALPVAVLGRYLLELDNGP